MYSTVQRTRLANGQTNRIRLLFFRKKNTQHFLVYSYVLFFYLQCDHLSCPVFVFIDFLFGETGELFRYSRVIESELFVQCPSGVTTQGPAL